MATAAAPAQVRRTGYGLSELEPGWDDEVAEGDREAVRSACQKLMQWVYFRQRGAPALDPNDPDTNLTRVLAPDPSGDFYLIHFEYPRGILFSYQRMADLVQTLGHRIAADGLEMGFTRTNHRPYVTLRLQCLHGLLRSDLEILVVHRAPGTGAGASTTPSSAEGRGAGAGAGAGGVATPTRVRVQRTAYPLTPLEPGWDEEVAPADRDVLRLACMILMRWVYHRQAGAPSLTADSADNELVRVIQPEGGGGGEGPRSYMLYYKYPHGVAFGYEHMAFLAALLVCRVALDTLEIGFDTTDNRPFVSLRLYSTRHLSRTEFEIQLAHRVSHVLPTQQLAQMHEGVLVNRVKGGTYISNTGSPRNKRARPTPTPVPDPQDIRTGTGAGTEGPDTKRSRLVMDPPAGHSLADMDAFLQQYRH